MLQPDFSIFPEIKTERLLLRRIVPADAAQILILRSDEAVLQYLDRAPTTTLEEAAALITKISDSLSSNSGITWAITLAEDPSTLIGTIGYWKITPEHYRAEIGYMLQPAHWRKGIVNEAMIAVMDYGFNTLMLHSIEANVNPANRASAGLLEKLGFVREAYFRENYYYNGSFIDSAIYSKLNN